MTWQPYPTSVNGYQRVSPRGIVWRGSGGGRNTSKTLPIQSEEQARRIISDLQEAINAGYFNE